MRVIGIDPGYDRVGVAVLEYQMGQEVVLFSTCIETDRTKTLTARCVFIGQQLCSIIEDQCVTHLAIESLFFNQNVSTALKVAEARGVILYVASLAGCTIHEFSPQAIKIAITGTGNSKKTDIKRMLHQLLPTTPQHALDDEYDAIAIGITCLAHHGRGA
jgi:crossover junction endodeoxyribonuclease RuvC